MKYIIANWKMQLNKSDAVRLAVECAKAHINNKNKEIVLCASFTALSDLRRKLKESDVKLGAQNVFYHDKGQYTGEISPLQLAELGVEYVILGHSERRKFLNETDEDVNRKLKISLEHNLIPILCIGETAEERRENKTEVTIIRQLTRCLEDIKLKDNQKILIAYEPVWAISPAPPAQPEDVFHAVQVIRHLLKDFFDQETLDKQIITIYGGSVDVKNMASFIKKGLIDGVLVGGASLTAGKFMPMITQ